MHKRIEEFLNYLTYERKYSENTIRSYATDLEDFNVYIENKKINYLRMTYSEVIDYMVHLSHLKLSSTSINRYLSAIRSFYEYMIKNNYVKRSPLKVVRGHKKEKRMPNYLN